MDGETVVSFVLGVVVGLAIGCGLGGSLPKESTENQGTKATTSPTTPTTTSSPRLERRAAMDILDDNPDCKIRRLMGLEAWAAKHNLLKPDGTPREIIGTLPVTADGVIVANQFETVYIVSQHGKVRESYLYHRGVSGAGSCYSTREAAERAAGGGEQ